MVDPREELKTRAEILHKRVAAGDPAARARLRALVELKTADDELLAVSSASSTSSCAYAVRAELPRRSTASFASPLAQRCVSASARRATTT